MSDTPPQPNNPLNWKDFFQWIEDLKMYAVSHNTSFITTSHINKGNGRINGKLSDEFLADYRFVCELKKINEHLYEIEIHTQDDLLNEHNTNEDIKNLHPYTPSVEINFKKKNGKIPIEEDGIYYPVLFKIQKERVPPNIDDTP